MNVQIKDDKVIISKEEFINVVLPILITKIPVTMQHEVDGVSPISEAVKDIIEMHEKEENKQVQLEMDITRYLVERGIKMNIKGFYFLREAILMCIKDERAILQITKGLYVDIARNNKTTPSRTERAMRHAIEFISYEGRKPCNSEFIAMVADEFRMKIRQNK